MPYLQLDIGRSYPIEVKRALAAELGRVYAEVMQTTAGKVVVAIRELGVGNSWRCGSSCTPAATLMCDIRSGRPPEQRARLAARMAEVCAALLEFEPEFLTVEFTQHSGDEFYRPGHGFVPNWSPSEAS
jgi:phenylpyruvate tautomerase PptA (4-oxalocrotonate tautomerase family)